MRLIDTHCHIQSAGASEREAGEHSTLSKWDTVPERTGSLIVQDAAQAGVTKMVCVGCDLEDSQQAVRFVVANPECYASIGIHPHEAERYAGNQASLDAFAALATADRVVAVGECGLDYFYGHSPQADQAEILRFQIGLALEHNLPMIFHVREAFDDFWPIFDSYSSAVAQNPIRGVLHSFTDTTANLDKAIERGLHIGVNGIATFAKDPKQLEMYKNIPLSRLLLETDAPFLTPSPYRGTICEPYHTKVIAEFLGNLRDEPLAELVEATTENAEKLFKI
jgi:TatD DNase family protein